MNPLLNRIFENKNRSKSKGPIPSSLDKVLVPKLTNRNITLQSLVNNQISTRVNPPMPKVYISKLPTLYPQRTKQQIIFQSQKKVQFNKSRVQFRARRMSSQFRQHQASLKNINQYQLSRKKFNRQDSQGDTLKKQQNSFLLMRKTTRSIKYQQDRPQVSTLKKFHKSINHEDQNQLFQYLKILSSNPDLSQQFCYMNRHSLPYSFYITDYSLRNPMEYLTVSLRGITYYSNQDSQFFTIKQFSKDIYLYQKINQIQYFSNYLKNKIIIHWKLAMVKKKFYNQCNIIKQKLNTQNQIKHKFISALFNLYQQFVNGNFFTLSLSSTVKDINILKSSIMRNKRQQIEQSFKYFQQQVRHLLIQCNKLSINKFRKQKRVTLGTSQRLQNDESFLPFDNKKKSMKYTQLAKLKQFQQTMYQLIKYTDLVRFSLKVDYVQNSLRNSIKQLQTLYSNYQNRNTRSFLSWLQAHVQLITNQQSNNSMITQIKNSNKCQIKMIPSVEDLRNLVIDHRNQSIKIIYSSHHYLVQQREVFLCTQYAYEGELPSKFQLKYFLQKQPQILIVIQQFERALQKLLSQIEIFLNYLSSRILVIYQSSILTLPIAYYLSNKILSQYLQTYQQEKQQIQALVDDIQFGLIYLNIYDLKQEIKKKYQQKYQLIINAIPSQINQRTFTLAQEIRQVYDQYKRNPQTIRQYILFTKKFQYDKNLLQGLQNKIQSLLDLQQMIIKNGIKINEKSKLSIRQSQILYRELQRRFQQIQQNEEHSRNIFYTKIDKMIPLIQQKSQQVLLKISQNTIISNALSQITIVQQQLNELKQQFQKINILKEQLFSYQKELQLGHKHLEQFIKLQIQLSCYINLWNGNKHYQLIKKQIQQKGYGQLEHIQMKSINQHLKRVENAQMDIQAVQLLQQFRKQTNILINVVKLGRLLAADTLQPQHQEQISSILRSSSKKIIDILFTREGSRTITCFQLYQQTNIHEIQLQISQIVFLSAQQTIIKRTLSEIQDYWKKSKLKFISDEIISPGVHTIHFDQNQQLQQKIGLFTLNLRNIQSSKHAKGNVLDRLYVQIKIVQYLRDLLELQAEVEKEWLKLLPMMTNCPSVKHQSNVYFQFSSVDTTMKKLIKQISDMTSMKKLVDDYQQKRNHKVLQKCAYDLKMINSVFQNFLQTKRTTYNRFYFLTDDELVTIIENVKDSRSFAKYGGLCFNCDCINMDNQLINGFETEHEIFKLRKTMLRGQPDEMFKSINENMNSSLKSAVRTLVPKMKISTNFQQQLKQNSLQVCMLSDYLMWTQMSQTYLNATSYEQYLLVTKRPCQEMLVLLPRCAKQLIPKLSCRLLQSLHLKQISQSLIQSQCTKHDFKWKQQMKYSFQEDQIVIRQFNVKLLHGLEYFPPSKVYVATLNTERFFMETYYATINNKVIVVNGNQGEGKRSLMKYTASRTGIYHKEVVCNANLNANYLMRFVQGALLAGAWLSFYQYSNLLKPVTYELFSSINSLKQEQKCHPRTLFLLINHSNEFQNISMFKFTNFTIVQPDHKKICQYLLQMYRFREWQELANKIISFLKVIKPLMQNVMGSYMSLVRKIVDGAGKKKINAKISDNQNFMVVKIIKRQIIEKSSEHISLLLNQALTSYFNVQHMHSDPKKKYTQKLSILKQIISKKSSKNIIVLGSRSCKSSLIKECLHQLCLQPQLIFPQSCLSFLTTYSIDYLNTLQSQKVLVYDGDKMLPQFSDLVTSGYLLIQGRKVVIKQKILMELRNIKNCTPSFIQKCNILYLGDIVTNLDKWNKYCHVDKDTPFYSILEEVFAEDLSRIQTAHIQFIAKFISRYKNMTQQRTIHKILIWLLSILGNQQIWVRHYAGKYSDYTVHQKYLQLVLIDPSRGMYLKQSQSPYLYVPTKSTILLTQLLSCLSLSQCHVQLYGSQQMGKSSLLKLIKGVKISLSVFKQTESWVQQIKKKLLVVRKEGKNHLIPVGESKYYLLVDDLDMGDYSHTTFLRALIQAGEIRDAKYQKYLPQDYNIVVTSRLKYFNSKADDRLIKIPMMEQSKQVFNTIYLTNVQNFTRSNGMNRELIDYLQRSAIKVFSILFDDFSKTSSPSIACSQLFTLLKSILSLPKKNSYISVEDFTSLFKATIYQKISEKLFNKKLQWQAGIVYENVVNVMFSAQKDWDYWLNVENAYKKTTYQDISKLVKDKYPYLIVYKSMVDDIVYLTNHLQSINSNVAVIGRKGVGKRHMVKISASLTKLPVFSTVSQVIFSVIKNIGCILCQQVKRYQLTLFQRLYACQSDQDLQVFLSISQKQKFRDNVFTTQNNQSTEIINKIKQLVKYVVLIDDKEEYMGTCQRFRQFNNFSVCILEEWPIQAIVGVYQTTDGLAKLHAQLFTTVNSIVIRNGASSMSMAIYQKYVRVYSQIYCSKKKIFEEKKQSLTKIYKKFNQSCSTIRLWQSKIKILQAQIQLSISTLSSAIQNNKLIAFVTFVLTKQLSQQQKQTLHKKTILQNHKLSSQQQLKKTKHILQKVQKFLSSLQRTQMSQLKKIYKTNRLIQFGIECLCILFKEEISDKSINKILADSNLLMKMKSSEILTVKNTYLITKFKKQITQIELNIKTTTSQTSKTLIQWIRSIIQYWETNQVYGHMMNSYKQLSAEYNKIKVYFDKISTDLKYFHQRSVKLNQQVNAMQKAKIQKQNQLNSLSIKLQNSSQIVPILLKTQQQISYAISILNNKLSTLIGNSILISILSVYLPLRRLTLRQKIFQQSKNVLKLNFITFSQSFINDVLNQNALLVNYNQTNSLEDLNLYLVQQVSGTKIIIDPQRKVFNYLQLIENKTHLLDQIVQKAQTILQGQFKNNTIYHTVSQNIYSPQTALTIDWKLTQMNPQQKLFNKIAYSKKPQYFKAKKQLNLRIEQNIKKTYSMKLQLYKQICKSQIKIIDDQKFIISGKQLLNLQQQTKRIDVQIKSQISLISQLQSSIFQQVTKIFTILAIFKQLRPIGLDLILQAASKQGNSIQNVISWALTNLQPSKRKGWLFALAHHLNKKPHTQLLHHMIINDALINNDVRIKKPALISMDNWDRMLKLSTYTQNTKLVLELVMKYPKQFQGWICDHSLLVPNTLLPESITFIEHLFMIFHLKPTIFPQSIQPILKQSLSMYSLNALSNNQLIQQSNPLYPIISHCSIFTLQKLCNQLNEDKIVKVNIGQIKNQADMKRVMWAAMDAAQWLTLYGITNSQHVQWIQKIVYYVVNYQLQKGFRVFIILDQVKYQQTLISQSTKQSQLIDGSKYLSSIALHIYEQSCTFMDLANYFNFFDKPIILSNLSGKSFMSEDENRVINVSQARHKNLQLSLSMKNGSQVNNGGQQKQQLHVYGHQKVRQQSMHLTQSILLKKPQHLRLCQRLYLHIILSHMVLIQKLPSFKFNHLQLLRRVISILKYIYEEEIPIQFNVQNIADYVDNIYVTQSLYKDRRKIIETINRIVDQLKFNQKTIYGVTFNNVHKTIPNNFAILGTDQAYFNQIAKQQLKSVFQTLDIIYNVQDIRQQTLFLKNILSRIPNKLSNKQIKNPSYLYFYHKEQKEHNKVLKRTNSVLEWIDHYSVKDENGEQVQPQNQYNWQNLLKRLRELTGVDFPRNQLHSAISAFTINLKKRHQFLLYLNPSHLSFSINLYHANFPQILLSTFSIYYLSKNVITDGFHYTPHLQFKKVTNQMHLSVVQGIILTNLNYHDWKFNIQHKYVESINGQINGQQKAPLVLYKMRKFNNTKKQDQQVQVHIPLTTTTLATNHYAQTILTLQFYCNSVYPEFYLRNNSFIVQ